MGFKLEPNNNNSPTSFNTSQAATINKLKAVSGTADVPLADNRQATTSQFGNKYYKKYKKTDSGKYIRNVSPASMNTKITESTSDKYAAINKKIDKDRQTVKGMDYKRKQNYNPFND